jgi:hypothetical protein
LEALDREVGVLEARSRRFTVLRSATFLSALAAWVVADLADAAGPGRGAALVLVGVFFFLVRLHRRVRAERRRVDMARQWAEEGLARLDRRWEALPAPEAGRDLTGHPYAADLDLYGPASLASLLAPVHTAPGRTTLDSWLLEPTDPSEVVSRQEAVRELARDWEQREATAVEGLLLEAGPRAGAPSKAAFDDFLEWCRGRDALPRWLLVAGWILPALTLGFLLGDLAGPLSSRWWVLTLFIQAGVAFGRARRLHSQFAMASTGLPGLRRYHALLRHWEDYPARVDYLAREVDRLGHGPTTSSRALARLERLLHLADLRLSTLHVVFAVALLWDVHVVQGLLKWRRTHGAHVEGWMEAMGRLEALSALATLDGDHPDWSYPELVTPDPLPRFQARALGHPLLPPDECVCNDVELGPPGTVLLVTGSNMSGKSTLLRSIGLATVLAGAGAPVCAEALRLPAVRLFTSMRVQDSLEAGVSYFMAELLRLKALLDEAPPLPRGGKPGEAETPSSDETPLLYLVDEILQGTNSEERQQAGRRLIRHLLRRWALGAVTTHDLDLHREAEVESSAVLVHFRETLDEAGEGLHFDYRLRSGLATTRNALRLAEKVGLTDPARD